MKEIIEKLNNLKIHQKSMDFLEDLPEEIYENYFKAREQMCNLDVEKHRWYETSISVFSSKEGHLGVRSVTDVFGESNCVEDMFHHLEFFEMEMEETITFKIK